MDWLYGYVEGTFLLQGLADVDLQLFLWSLYAPHLISVQGNWSRNSSLPPKVVLQCYTLYSKTHGFFVSYTMVYGPTAVGSTTSRGLRKGYFETKPSGIAVYRKGNIEHNSVSRHRMKVFNSASRSSTYWICCLLRSDKRAEIEPAGYTSFYSRGSSDSDGELFADGNLVEYFHTQLAPPIPDRSHYCVNIAQYASVHVADLDHYHLSKHNLRLRIAWPHYANWLQEPLLYQGLIWHKVSKWCCWMISINGKLAVVPLFLSIKFC